MSRNAVLVVVALFACGHDASIDVDGGVTNVSALRARLGWSATSSLGFVDDGERLRITADESRGVPQTIVALPHDARSNALVEDATSNVAIEFALHDASDSTAQVFHDVVIYRRALHGADVVHHARPDGTEDDVLFESKPEREEVVYDIDVSRVSGLRLVSNTLELLDAHGAPRLRVAAPFVLSADGAKTTARASLTGCAFDESATPPWDRAPTPPASSTCQLHLTWSSVRYPAVLDPLWSATGGMTFARYGHAAALLQNGRVVVVSGGNATAEIYDPVSGTFATTGSMPDNRTAVAAALLPSGKVLVVGGVTTALLFDPVAGTFTSTGDLVVGRYQPSAMTLSTGKVLIVGGTNNSTTAELYDPNQGTFAATGSANVARLGQTATLLANGKVLVAGGSSSAVSEVYDPSLGTFATSGAMSEGRSMHTATRLQSGKVLIAGGTSDTTAELYDPSLGTFAPTGSMTSARSQAVAGLLSSGKVIVSGGYTIANGYLITTELYDPAAGTFSTMSPLPANASQQTATSLATGNVLVAGGSTQLSQYIYQSLTTALIFSDQTQGGQCGSDAECTNGSFCVDGVCCNTQCTGQCEACDVTTSMGTCTPITGVPHGVRAPCAGSGTTCGGSCAQNDPLQCTYTTSGTPCGSSCSNATESSNTCDGQGHCATGVATGCPNHFACAGPTACKTTCTLNVDCASGYVCENGACVVGGGCINEYTASNDAGASQDCTPFKCDTNGACKDKCASVSDCVSPAVCDSTGICRTLANNSSGCSMATGSRSDGGAWTLVTLMLLGARRRPCRRRLASSVRR